MLFWTKIVFIILNISALFFSILTIQVEKPKYYKCDTKIISHRLNSEYENTIEGIIKTLNNFHIDGFEMDVQSTLDNVLVLYHDLFLNSKTNGTGRVIDNNYDYISRVRYNYDNNIHITKLKWLVKYFKNDNYILYFDLKDMKSINNILNFIRSYNLNKNKIIIDSIWHNINGRIYSYINKNNFDNIYVSSSI